VNYVAIVRSLQIKIIVAQGTEAAGWVGAVGHCKCNGMVKVDNRFVLTVTNLGTIVDAMLAIPALLHDQVGVTFPWRWNNLYFDPETKDSIHFSQIDDQVPYLRHAAVIYGEYSMTKILQPFFLNLVNLLSKYSPLSESLIALGGLPA
jgi:hypothetical protein